MGWRAMREKKTIGGESPSFFGVSETYLYKAIQYKYFYLYCALKKGFGTKKLR
jgi:hypothetical protein